MKIKTLLITISCTFFLFTSCEKDEMDKAGGAGTGKEDSMVSASTRTIRVNEIESSTSNKNKALVIDSGHSDSLSYISNKLSD